MDITLNMTDMDMADLLDELTYRLLANADTRAQARDRAAILGHWAHQQAARLATGRGLRVDHTTVVYLTNPQGQLVEVLAHENTPAEAARQIRQAMDA
ncbi:MAG: hypothetical protein KY446_06525 [Proteobacteria bacterium]|nr:hypothetical protein [Pseudomonadota bacterium]